MSSGAIDQRTPCAMPVFDHLDALTDVYGLFEHALYATPRTEHGYCVDDNARALLVASPIVTSAY